MGQDDAAQNQEVGQPFKIGDCITCWMSHRAEGGDNFDVPDRTVMRKVI